MQAERGVVGVYTDRELLVWALERITEPEFKYEVVRENSAVNVSGGEAPGIPSAIIVDSQTGVFELIRRLSGTFRKTPLVVWQRSRANEPSLNALDWGAAGVLHDNSSRADVLDCLKSVTKGFAWIPDSVAQAASRSRRCHLSRREGQLLSLVVQGLRNKEIAYSLKISEGTVKVYFSRLFRKLGVSDRYELALLGLRNCVPASGLPGKDAAHPSEYEPVNSIYVNRTLGYVPALAQDTEPSNILRL